MNVLIGISNRHVHLNKEDYKLLFGDKPLINIKDLNQNDQFAAEQCVDLISNGNTIKNVRIVGPLREYTQIEISKTDSYFLDINPPVRNSGDLSNSSPIMIKGPNNTISKTEGCIISTRHIHINQEEANKYGFKDNEIVSVKINSQKSCIMNNVYIKIGNYNFEMHIDTDDANANLISNKDYGEIIK